MAPFGTFTNFEDARGNGKKTSVVSNTFLFILFDLFSNASGMDLNLDFINLSTDSPIIANLFIHSEL